MSEILKTYGPWLLFGALMFFMMRRGGCCGGHGGHSGRGGSGEPGGHNHGEGDDKTASSKKGCCH